jgi:putative polyketide hydroxylase
MAVARTDVAVLIVGGGPVGLTARALLRRWRVPSTGVRANPFP